MNWSVLANIAEVVGTLVVVASLGYVGIQIRQNTHAMKNLAAHNLTAANSEANLAISTNDELAMILQRGFLDRSELTAHEQLRFNTFFFSAYNHYDFAYRQYLEGQIEEVSWKKMEREVPLFIHLPGVADWWEQDKQRFSEDFVKFVDGELKNFVPPDTLPTFGRENDRAI